MKYTKKPVTIDAMQFDGKNFDEVIEFTEHKAEKRHCNNLDTNKTTQVIVIPTLEGDMMARPGDYIIRGINGEYYPCKPDIFAKTYVEGDVGDVSYYLPEDIYGLPEADDMRDMVRNEMTEEELELLHRAIENVKKEIVLAGKKHQRWCMLDKTGCENVDAEIERALEISGYKIASNVGGFAIQW